MGVETCKECGEPLGLHTDMEGNHFCGGWVAKKYREGLQAQRMDIDAMRAELDTLRAQNASLVSAAQKQDQRAHELMMERRELARHAANSWTRRCPGCGLSKTETRVAGHLPCCPVALAERILAEPTATAGATGPGDCHNGQTNPRAISGDKAPYLAQGVES